MFSSYSASHFLTNLYCLFPPSRSPRSHLDRYPNHEASKRIEETEEYKAEIQKLRDNDGDFHHGFNTGVLAATRMFKEKADILHVNDFEVRIILLKFALSEDNIFIRSTDANTWTSSYLHLQELSAELLNEGAKHSKKIEAATKAFPHVEVTNDGFPEGN